MNTSREFCMFCLHLSEFPLHEISIPGVSPPFSGRFCYGCHPAVRKHIMEKLESKASHADSRVSELRERLRVIDETQRWDEKILASEVEAAKERLRTATKFHEAGVKAVEDAERNAMERYAKLRGEATKELGIAEREREIRIHAMKGFASQACNAGASNAPAADSSAAGRLQAESGQAVLEAEPEFVRSVSASGSRGGAAEQPDDRESTAPTVEAMRGAEQSAHQQSEAEMGGGSSSPSVDSQANHGPAVVPVDEVIELNSIINGRDRDDIEPKEGPRPDPEKRKVLLHPKETEFTGSTGGARRGGRQRRGRGRGRGRRVYFREAKSGTKKSSTERSGKWTKWTPDEDETLKELVNEYSLEGPEGPTEVKWQKVLVSFSGKFHGHQHGTWQNLRQRWYRYRLR